MASDLKIDIDNVRLNIRAGTIIKFDNEIIIEISKVGLNSVIPGGRIKINEHSKDALVRELKEEMNFEFDKERFNQIKVFENFFNYGEKDFHEIYFLYEYKLNQNEYEILKTLNMNNDNENTFFKFVSKYEVSNYNLLPLELHEVIKS